MLQVSHISFNYPDQRHFAGIRDISFRLVPGEVMALVGKSGSGKTTLLKCLYGLEDLQSGEIHLADKKVLGPSWNLMPGNPDMKLVTQEYYVLENHTVAENVYDKLIGFSDELKAKRTKRILKLLELEPLRDMRARMLSSGQRQRVAIARALAVIPKVLLLDEPFSNLDKILAEKLFAFITREAKKRKTSVLLITHVPEEALKHADRIAVIHEGRLLQLADKWIVYYQPKNIRLAGLLGDFNVIPADDLESGADFRTGRVFLRPDQLQPVGKGGDLRVTTLNCTFNGKCWEILAETASGKTVLVYWKSELATGDTISLKIAQPQTVAANH